MAEPLPTFKVHEVCRMFSEHMQHSVCVVVKTYLDLPERTFAAQAKLKDYFGYHDRNINASWFQLERMVLLSGEVLANPNMPMSHLIWLLAHEVGHFLAHQAHNQGETQADFYAAFVRHHPDVIRAACVLQSMRGPRLETEVGPEHQIVPPAPPHLLDERLGASIRTASDVDAFDAHRRTTR